MEKVPDGLDDPNMRGKLAGSWKEREEMFLKATPDSEAEVIEDLGNIRSLSHGWQERIIRPEYVFMAAI